MSNSGQSCVVATTLSILLIAAMQICKTFISSSRLATIFGGFLGSNLFLLILTALGNLENFLFGSSFQTNLFPEVVSCLVISAFISGMVHRVCFTTCIIFSLVALYYINKISDSIHNYHQYQSQPKNISHHALSNSQRSLNSPPKSINKNEVKPGGSKKHN